MLRRQATRVPRETLVAHQVTSTHCFVRSYTKSSDEKDRHKGNYNQTESLRWLSLDQGNAMRSLLDLLSAPVCHALSSRLRSSGLQPRTMPKKAFLTSFLLLLPQEISYPAWLVHDVDALNNAEVVIRLGEQDVLGNCVTSWPDCGSQNNRKFIPRSIPDDGLDVVQIDVAWGDVDHQVNNVLG